jgi:hypothetical protein
MSVESQETLLMLTGDPIHVSNFYFGILEGAVSE